MRNFSALLMVMFFCLGCLAGCAALAGILPQEQAVDEQTGELLYLQPIEDGKSIITTNAVDPVTKIPNAPYNQISESSVVGTIVNTGKTVSGFLPPPFDILATALAGLGASGATWWIRKQNAAARAGKEIVRGIENNPDLKQLAKEKLGPTATAEARKFVKAVTG